MSASILTRAAEVLHSIPGIECDHVDWKQPTCERDAQALANAGLLREQEPAQGGLTEADLEALWNASVEHAWRGVTTPPDALFAVVERILAAHGGRQGAERSTDE